MTSDTALRELIDKQKAKVAQCKCYVCLDQLAFLAELESALAPQDKAIEQSRLRCGRCGKSVSTPVPPETIVRAFIECPECIEADSTPSYKSKLTGEAKGETTGANQ